VLENCLQNFVGTGGCLDSGKATGWQIHFHTPFPLGGGGQVQQP